MNVFANQLREAARKEALATIDAELAAYTIDANKIARLRQWLACALLDIAELEARITALESELESESEAAHIGHSNPLQLTLWREAEIAASRARIAAIDPADAGHEIETEPAVRRQIGGAK